MSLLSCDTSLLFQQQGNRRKVQSEVEDIIQQAERESSDPCMRLRQAKSGPRESGAMTRRPLLRESL
ncbi:hypothetical protein FA13DRAFT_1736624 [Coprinellus micaceus]|uniref:Uncharacterized protein n=1 Tax=Coprinellus micaceus TaxID=71717 RepID=A0A4Y7SZE1_COPMI|nr:hypothetical protein FA13DRAFT_1736624 [Coprinellus micaceus]